MEPDKNLTSSEETNRATLANLKDEGVEIEDGSRHADENEFSTEGLEKTPVNQGVQTLNDEAKKILSEMSMASTIKKEMVPPTTEMMPQKPSEQKISPKPYTETVATASANDPSIHQLRTFRMDAEEAVRDQHVSKADIAIAEQKKRESTPIEYTNEEKSKAPFLILIFVIICVLIGAGGYVYFRTQSVTPTSKPNENIHSIITPDRVITLSATPDGNSIQRIAEATKNITGTVGSITFVALADFGTTTQQLPLSSVLRSALVPDKLVRSLTNEYMFGIHIFDGSVPFIILKTSFFQNAYPGMLEWEKNMRNGLLPLIQIARPDVTAIDANTDLFRDRVISNKDVRELDDRAGVPILLYTFADKDTIVITTNEKSLREILDKLLAVRVVQ